MNIKELLISGKLRKIYLHEIKHNKFSSDMWGKRCERISHSIDVINFYCDLFQNFKGFNVLDVGCNSGFFSFLISDFASNVIGVDKIKSSIDCADKMKNKLEIRNTDFVSDYIGSFITNGKYKEYNIDACFIHKVTGQLVKSEFNALKSILSNMKVIVVAGKDFNDPDIFDVESKGNKIFLLKKKVVPVIEQKISKLNDREITEKNITNEEIVDISQIEMETRKFKLSDQEINEIDDLSHKGTRLAR